MNACMSTSPQSNWQGSPRRRRTLHRRGLRKTGAQLRDNPEEREKNGQRPKNPVKPHGRHKHRHTARRNNVQISSANRAWTSEAPSRRKYEILPKARGLTHERSTTAHRNNVQIFKCELGLRIGVHIHVENVGKFS